jgi:hypothetical protein
MKLKMIMQLFIIVLLACGALASCTWEQVKPPKKLPIPDSVKFSTNILPIFSSNCALSGCHVKGGQSPDLSAQNAYTSLIYYGYVNVDFPDQSIIYQKITTGSMGGKATITDEELILKWIQQGALNN